MTRERNTSTSYLVISLVFIVIAITIFFIFFIFNNKKSEEIIITGDVTVTGLTCKNDTLVNPILVDVKANSYNNKISAIFNNDKLGSISYYFVGRYDSGDTASFADGMAVAKYNKTIANYGVNENAYYYTHSTEGGSLTISLTVDSGNLSSKVAPLFLLSDTSTFPKNLDVFRNAYEKEGFVCDVTK